MPKIVDKKAKAKSISDAALRVFRELGYPHTRMADIAEAAGIGKGTVYEYFKNKADILRFAFEQYFNTFNEGALQTMMEKIDPADRMIALVDFALRHVDEWEDHCAVYVDYFGVARTDEQEWFSLAGINDQMKHVLEDLIKEGQASGEMDTHSDPEVVAELLLALFDGIIFHRIFVGQDSDRDSMHTSAIRFVTRGLLEVKDKQNGKHSD